MNDKEAKAIILLRTDSRNLSDDDFLDMTTTIKNLVEGQNRELKIKDKMINEMAEELYLLFQKSDEDCFILEYSSINDCVKRTSCIDCIKEYFRKKVEKNIEMSREI